MRTCRYTVDHDTTPTHPPGNITIFHDQHTSATIAVSSSSVQTIDQSTTTTASSYDSNSVNNTSTPAIKATRTFGLETKEIKYSYAGGTSTFGFETTKSSYTYTSTAATATSTKRTDNSKPNTALIVGVALGTFGFLAASTMLFYYCRRRRYNLAGRRSTISSFWNSPPSLRHTQHRFSMSPTLFTDSKDDNTLLPLNRPLSLASANSPYSIATTN